MLAVGEAKDDVPGLGLRVGRRAAPRPEAASLRYWV